MKKINKNLTSFSDHLDQQYGKKDTAARKKFEQEFEVFKREVMLQEKVNENLKQGDDLKSIAKEQKNKNSQQNKNLKLKVI
ncbi:MAG: transcriptional regulator [Ignavibacteriae bacterium]|nr:transcriptional regulator [Ignavibacteriota bacterium]